jgi:hypothetical protein
VIKWNQERVEKKAAEHGYGVLGKFLRSHDKIKLLCPNGHKWDAFWDSFANRGSRCPECQYTIWNQERAERFAEGRGYKLISKFKTVDHKVDLICSNGHPWSPIWYNFQKGCECAFCTGHARWNTERAQKYSESRGYKLMSNVSSSHDEVALVCKKGHVWKTLWYSFKNGHECAICADNQCFTNERVSSIVNEFGYKLLNDYKNTNGKIELMCPKGHVWETTLTRFQNGTRCIKCVGNEKLSRDIVKTRAKERGYELLSNYESSLKKITLRCEKGHLWDTIAGNFLYHDTRCPFCTNRPESEINDWLTRLGVKFNHLDRIQIKPKELDFFVPDRGLAIEFCGLYWHSEMRLPKNYHVEKLQKCREVGISLLTIFGDEWEFKQDIVKSIVMHKLGLSQVKLSARKGEVKEISYREAKEFFEKNHLMGGTLHKAVGLFISDKLVSCLSYCIKKESLEIMRFASVLNTNVRGAFGKLLSFLKDKEVDQIVSFVDLRYGDGHSYSKLGFQKVKRTLGWKWTDFRRTYNRLKCRANMDDRKLSQAEHASEMGFCKIFDCGQEKYTLKL